MKALVLRGRMAWVMILVVGACLLMGCASNRAAWDARVGVFSFDDAVAELGPPDKEAVLSDGSRVAEWMTRRGERGGFSGYYGPYYRRPYPYARYYGPLPGYYYDPGSPDYWIRLTFGADGRMAAWKKLTK
jgi:hypothetical protein